MAMTDKEIDAYIEEVLCLMLVGFGSGVGAAATDDPGKKPRVALDVCARLRDRYRKNLKSLVVKFNSKFEEKWEYYLLMRSRQIGTKAARMMVELSQPTITADLFEASAVEVEAESKRTADRFRGIYGEKLDIACPD